MLAGRRPESLEAFRKVIELYPRTALASEAQYRIGYVQETLGDDFDAARAEYGRVQSHAPGSPFTSQAAMRLANLDRLAQYRNVAGPDSVGKKVESAFMLAELYLFQLDKADRALEEYRKIAAEHAGTPHAGKALNAQAWVLRNKMKEPARADSLLWAVVREYPATESQLDARDYLERAGHVVPAELIKMPERPRPALPDTAQLTPVPAADSLGPRVRPAFPDSLFRLGSRMSPERPRPGVLVDSLRMGAPRDTTRAAADTTRSAAPADTTRPRRRVDP
jgi:hypothetical protein